MLSYHRSSQSHTYLTSIAHLVAPKEGKEEKR